MEFLFELLAEIVIEGSIELGTSRKVPWILRILLLLLVGGVYILLLVAITSVGIDCLERGDTSAAVIILAVDVLIAAAVIYMFVKSYKKNRK